MIGNVIKVHITASDELARETGLAGESLWITITEEKDDYIRGRLENHPILVDHNYGDELWFKDTPELIPEFVGESL